MLESVGVKRGNRWCRYETFGNWLEKAVFNLRKKEPVVTVCMYVYVFIENRAVVSCLENTL